MGAESHDTPMMLSVSLRHAFSNFSLDAAFSAPGEGITALFGPSGSGKSTIVNAIAGLFRPDFTKISLNGAVLADSDRGVFLPARRRRVGYVFQDARLFPHMTVGANILFGWRRTGRNANAAEIAHLVDLLGIGHLMHRRPASLSGGERQRAALARALLAAPSLLLLDEPLAALDEARKQEILPYFERLRDETRLPMIYVSHSLEEVTRLAHHLVLIEHGCILASGNLFEVTQRLELLPLLGGENAGAVLAATIRAHYPEEGLTELALEGGRLFAALLNRQPGEMVRLRIRANDVMISLTRPEDISANNVLQADIVEMRLAENPHATLLLACGKERIIAKITRNSAERLRLEPGKQVFAIIKAVNVERGPQTGA